MIRRVAVTGIGVVTPLGNNPDTLFENLMQGKSGISRISSDFSAQLATTVTAECAFQAETFFSKKQARSMDRVSQIAVAAARMAWEDSGLAPEAGRNNRSGVYMGTGMGGAHTIEDTYKRLFIENMKSVSPLSVVMVMNNAAAYHISMEYGLAGSSITYSVACASSAVALGEAARQIRHGYADVMLAGGAESLLTYGVIKCWEALGTLAREYPGDASASCRPFSKDRSGFVLGEGAAVLILEELERAQKRGAHIYGELAGYGTSSDAQHITRPEIDGQSGAIKLALEDAGLGPEDIDYINAHGTATSLNDLVETQAIKKVFGPRAYQIPISSTKSMHGHLMGAAGAVEFAIALLSIKYQSAPPTAHLLVPDPECDLDYVAGTGRPNIIVEAAMSNSFAFGGANAVLIARKV